jgi:ornithine cyclodeaminase
MRKAPIRVAPQDEAAAAPIKRPPRGRLALTPPGQEPPMTLRVYDAAAVEALLDYPGCIEAMRSAMEALSSGPPQPLRQMFEIAPGRRFGLMPGSMPAARVFGAKVASVFAEPGPSGRARHQGVVLAYDGDTGALVCVADAETVTEIRTACATAAATRALARPDARVLAVFGLGAQARSHIRALGLVRDFDEVLLWGRSAERAKARAEALSEALGRAITPVASGREAAARADVICTVTGAAEPILLGDWVSPGVHVNLVGSSYLGPAEVDSALVAKGRYIADYRPSVLAQASELAIARQAGLVDDSHVVGEIGEVFLGKIQGRQAADQVTLYKSLGNIAQDLAAAVYLDARATRGERGAPSDA